MHMARKELENMHPGLRERILFAAMNCDQDDIGNLRDPIELDPVFGKLVKEASARAEKTILDIEIGRCHQIWDEQARILKQEHGIDWYSPAQMNPWNMYD